MLRQRLISGLRRRGGAAAGPRRWATAGQEEPPKGHLFNRTPREDWELPCYVTSFLAIVILGVGLNAKPDLTIETWAHHKALDRLRADSD